MSNAAVIAVLDEFDEIIHGLVGLYFDASTGFSFVKEMNERNLKTLIPNHQYDPAKPPRPDEIVAQLKEARAQIGCGVVDLSFQTPGLGTS
jgi:hypothetical protein